jgi:predicted ATP-binding protein involved in virulence
MHVGVHVWRKQARKDFRGVDHKDFTFVNYLAELAIIQVPGGLGDISDLLAESVKKRNILFIIIYMQIYIREESDYIEDGRRL